jgi:intein/homing endonuclease
MVTRIFDDMIKCMKDNNRPRLDYYLMFPNADPNSVDIAYKNAESMFDDYSNQIVIGSIELNRYGNISDEIESDSEEEVETHDLPKDKYVYGTDFNTEKRENSEIPDKFLLNKENGIFIGLFLADGNTDFNDGTISITKNNIAVQDFVKGWFSKKFIETNKVIGTSCTVKGCSRVLISFLDKFVGKGSCDKHIPLEAYTAPEEFIIGLLNGYFSGDGWINKNSINASSVSPILTDGISMLCSRLGIFCKVSSSHVLTNNLGTENIKRVYFIFERGKAFCCSCL